MTRDAIEYTWLPDLVILVAYAVFLAFCAVVLAWGARRAARAVRRRLRRRDVPRYALTQRQQFEAEERAREGLRQAYDISGQALAMLCDPCNGVPGTCGCPVKCDQPLCPAADTGITMLTAEQMRYLRYAEQQMDGGDGRGQ